MGREPVTVEALPARLRFKVLAEGEPVKGAYVELQLLEPFFDVPEELKRMAEEAEKEYGYRLYGVLEAKTGRDGVVDVVLPAGFWGVWVSKRGYREAGFGVVLAVDMVLPPVQLERGEGEGFTDLGVFAPDFAACGEEEGVRVDEDLTLVPVKVPSARLQFSVLAEGKPAEGAVVELQLVEPYFEVPERMAEIMQRGVGEREIASWGTRRIEVGASGEVDVELPVGFYFVWVRKRGYREVVFGVSLAGDVAIPPVKLRRGRGRPVALDMYFSAEVETDEKGKPTALRIAIPRFAQFVEEEEGGQGE